MFSKGDIAILDVIDTISVSQRYLLKVDYGRFIATDFVIDSEKTPIINMMHVDPLTLQDNGDSSGWQAVNVIRISKVTHEFEEPYLIEVGGENFGFWSRRPNDGWNKERAQMMGDIFFPLFIKHANHLNLMKPNTCCSQQFLETNNFNPLGLKWMKKNYRSLVTEIFFECKNLNTEEEISIRTSQLLEDISL